MCSVLCSSRTAISLCYYIFNSKYGCSGGCCRVALGDDPLFFGVKTTLGNNNLIICAWFLTFCNAALDSRYLLLKVCHVGKKQKLLMEV